MGYGFGLYRWGVWFGIGQIQLRSWAVDMCLFKMFSDDYPNGYNKHWLTVDRRAL